MTIAHAAIAEAAGFTDDLVVLVTSGSTLPKEGQVEDALFSPEQRARAVRAWCEIRDGFVHAICSHGLLADQVRAARVAFPHAALSVFCGSDKLLQLFDPKWYEDRDQVLGALFGEATVTYAMRAGDRSAVAAALADPANRRWRARCRKLPSDPSLASVSSREVRRRVRSGAAWRDFVPPEVAASLTT